MLGLWHKTEIQALVLNIILQPSWGTPFAFRLAHSNQLLCDFNICVRWNKVIVFVLPNQLEHLGNHSALARYPRLWILKLYRLSSCHNEPPAPSHCIHSLPCTGLQRLLLRPRMVLANMRSARVSNQFSIGGNVYTSTSCEVLIGHLHVVIMLLT